MLALAGLGCPHWALAQSSVPTEPRDPFVPGVATQKSEATEPTDEPSTKAPAPSGVFGTNVWAGRGARTTASAFGMPPLSVGLSVGLDAFAQRNLFSSQDQGLQSVQRMALSFAPVEGLELALTARSLAFEYRHVLVPRNLMLQGNPGLQVKYARHVVGPLALGARVSAVVPPSISGSGASFKSTLVRGELLLSVQPTAWFEWMLNVGYAYDGTRWQWRSAQNDAVQRFVYGINFVDRLLWSTAAQARIAAGRHVDVVPFVDVAGEAGFTGGASAKRNPVSISVGARVLPSQSRAVEFAVGADLRASGAPQSGSPYAGLPLYQVFGQLSVHFGDGVARPTASAAPCALGDGFRVHGAVLDAGTGQPVAAASVSLDDSGARLTSDPNDGQFVSWLLPRQGDALRARIEAPGYKPDAQALARPLSGDAHVSWRLSAEQAARNRHAHLRGVVRHALTGEPLARAVMRIEGLDKPVAIGARGMFHVALPPGTHRVSIGAPGFATQRKQVRIGAQGDVVWNIDLEPVEQ